MERQREKRKKQKTKSGKRIIAVSERVKRILIAVYYGHRFFTEMWHFFFQSSHNCSFFLLDHIAQNFLPVNLLTFPYILFFFGAGEGSWKTQSQNLPAC